MTYDLTTELATARRFALDAADLAERSDLPYDAMGEFPRAVVLERVAA
jgi:hypothetical protein